MFADRYELEEVLGTGGMSRVYRARDRLLERAVALKVLHDSHHADAEAIERFRREAEAVAQLSHPNIVSVIDRGEADGTQFIVFELVEGESLKDLVAQAGRLPVRRALALALEVGRALAFAHEHGIVHRDVKPQNVLLNGDGTAKVTDFGIARSGDGGGVTQTGTVLGTSNYMAPEQATGSPVAACTDVYSLGVVLFELLTGNVPFDGGSFLEVAMRHVHDPVPDIRLLRPDVPERVAQAVERAMAKDPSERFASMADMVAELETCLAEPDQVEARPDEATIVSAPAPVRAPRRRRRPWPLAVALVAVTAALVAAALAIVLVDGSPPGLAVLDPPAPPEPVELSAVVSHDPHGDDGSEHADDVPYATDGDPGTYWTTSSYRYPRGEFGKAGVGLLLSAGKAMSLEELTVLTDTPGFTAEIRAGESQEGPFEMVAAEAQEIAEESTFELDAEARYWLVWITNRGANPSVHINEVKAAG